MGRHGVLRWPRTSEAISKKFGGRGWPCLEVLEQPTDVLSPGLILIDSPYEPYTEYLAWNLSVSESPSVCGVVPVMGRRF